MNGSSVQADTRGAAALFAALGDETRLGLLARMCEAGPQSIVGLTRQAEVTRQAVTKHLQALQAAGLVTGRRVGRERVWELRPERLDDVHRYLRQISERWDVALARLRVLVEENGGRTTISR